MERLRCLTNHLVPGTWEEVRPPNETEMIKTRLLSLPLNEVSAKARSGPPLDLEDVDYPIRVWAWVVLLRSQVEDPIADPHALPGIPVVDKGRFDRADGFAGRTTVLADVRLPQLPVYESQRNRECKLPRLTVISRHARRADACAKEARSWHLPHNS